MIPVVDLFAGPGGLNEGFSRVCTATGEPVYNVVASFEMGATEIETLRLRSAVRRTEEAFGEPAGIYKDFLNGRCTYEDLARDAEFGAALAVAREEACQVELGPAARDGVDEIISERLAGQANWGLIGGPPCQAYSLAGRSRRTHDETFLDDKKHFLFEEYLHILWTHSPTFFVMENVKGLLSATHRDTRMFDRIIHDLSCDGEYEIRSLVAAGSSPEPSDFVIRAERHGVPQARHRVILVGVRRGLASEVPQLRTVDELATVRDAIGAMPAVRSKVSRGKDSEAAWAALREEARRLSASSAKSSLVPPLEPSGWVDEPPMPKEWLEKWIRRSWLRRPVQHDARSHMDSDLLRYGYLSYLALRGEVPTVSGLPAALAPAHQNVAREAGQIPFVDRFKVQRWDRPSSTVTSHISKDGHHYIHPDPQQMRSLTVREAARLQTFPDDYFFMGTRTAQFHQVGNAVPPYLAFQIGQALSKHEGIAGLL